MFKKFMGEVNFQQVSLFFSVIGILNFILLWPVVMTLYFTEAGRGSHKTTQNWGRLRQNTGSNRNFQILSNV